MGYCRRICGKEHLENWRNLPRPSEVNDRYFLSELAWCVYNAGMSEQIVAKKWPALKEAYREFDAKEILHNREDVLADALKVVNHPEKAKAVVFSVEKVLRDGPIGELLSRMKVGEALEYFHSYPYIGNVTKYHLARNVGFDVAKPDRHLIRLAKILGYDSPGELVAEIAELTGEKKGFVDYVLWLWLSREGKHAYDFARGFADGMVINVVW